MHIDSAREVKSTLLKQYLRSVVVAPAKLGVMAAAARAGKQVHPGHLALRTIGARAVDKVDPIQRSFSLGVARKAENDFRLAVRIQTRALEKSPLVETFVKHAKGEADVVYIGRIVKRQTPWTQQRLRPLEIGTSIGHFKITAGTLGCFVKKRSGGTVRILSNNHVLANENAAKKGDAIIQPGRYDGGIKGKDTAGTLDTFVRLRTNQANFVDCALAALKIGIEFDGTAIQGLGQLAGLGPAVVDLDAPVEKVGRTTEHTRGRVTAFELDNVVVGYDFGNLRFDNQIEIEGADEGPFSQGGDSGSLILDADHRGVALLFAGGDEGGLNGKGLTFANPLHTVLDELSVDLVS